MTEPFALTKITSKGQVTLPAPTRKMLGIREGDYLAVYVRGDEVILKKLEPLKEASRQDSIFKLLGEGYGPQDLAEQHDKYLADGAHGEAE